MDQSLIIMEDRLRIRQFSFRVDFPVIPIDPDPGSSICKSGSLAAVPLHRRSGIVPPFGVDGPHDLLLRIPGFQTFLIHMKRLDVPILSDLIVRVRHAQFLSLVDIGRSLHAVENRGQHLSRLHTVLLVIAPPRYDPRQIVIVPEEAVPAAPLQLTLPFV